MLDLTMWETVEKPQCCEASSFTPKAQGDGDDDDDSDDDAGVSLGAGHRANWPAVKCDFARLLREAKRAGAEPHC